MVDRVDNVTRRGHTGSKIKYDLLFMVWVGILETRTVRHFSFRSLSKVTDMQLWGNDHLGKPRVLTRQVHSKTEH